MKHLFIFLILSILGKFTAKAQLQRAHYKIVTEYRTQPDSIQANQNLSLAVLNQIMKQESLVPILETTAAPNRIKFRYLPPQQSNSGLSIQMPNVLIVYNKEKEKTTIYNAETQIVKEIWMLSSDEHELLKDKDTLINGKSLRMIELGLKDSPEKGTRLFYIDETLPENITPIYGDFQKELNVKGGIREYHVIHEDKILKYILKSHKEIPTEVFLFHNITTLPEPIEKIAFF